MSTGIGRSNRAYSVVYASGPAEPPGWACAALARVGPRVTTVHSLPELVALVRRSRPAVVLVDDLAGTLHASTTVVCQLKADAYTAVVPCVVLYRGDLGAALIDAGADEAIDRDRTSDTEGFARVVAAVRRSTRDLAAQPTTHLPGAGAIEAEIERRLHAGVGFAACYADLDHFKEFNDRYGFHEGDRVIRMLGRLLHDTAAGLVGPNAFVGHVGGDDFMLVVPAASAADLCGLVLEVFDALVPYQYTDSDRRAGYYFGKDRRGQLHRVPLMTLSIGVATTERRGFTSAGEVSRLATEMKSFAKARAGSVFAVDRRAEQDVNAGASGSPITPG